jgi:hypothetical protein
MNIKAPFHYLRLALTGLSVAAVLGVGLTAACPIERPVTSVAPRLIVDNGQETHGGGKGGRRSDLRVADGQETHGKNGGRRSALRIA